MLLKPTIKDFKVIGYYTGLLTLLIGLFMSVPLITAIIFVEYERAIDFVIGMASAIIFGSLLMGACEKTVDLTWIQGLIVVAMTWLFAMFFGSIPLYLSGQYIQFIDALFDAMSGFTTTGLAVIQGLDHVPNSINMWRHLTQFIGGQGIAVVGLTFLIRIPGAGGAFEMYAGEAREERILPHVRQTSKFIWKVSLVYLFIGTGALFAAMVYEGMAPVRSLMQASWIFMAAWDTGGFTPQSQSILYYHSGLIELLTVALMIGGSLSFGLHYSLWNRRLSEIRKNIETTVWFFSVILLVGVVYIGLLDSKLFVNGGTLFRKGFYQLVSAHTGTGYQTVNPFELTNSWQPLAFTALVIAMGLGGSASSTAGGVKMLRVGVIIKFLTNEIKKMVLPESAIIVEKYHLLKTMILQDKLIKASFLVFVLYISSYILGAVAIMLYGYPISQAIFESTSAAANVGLSSGITSATMPMGLKIIFIIQMWTGRLEFMSIFAVIGLFIALIRGR